MKYRTKLILHLIVCVIIPLAFMAAVVGGFIKDAKEMRTPDAESVEPALPTEPLVVIPTLPSLAPSLIDVFSDQHGIAQEDRERLENIYSQYETPGEMSDKERLASLSAVLFDLANIVQDDSLRHHGQIGGSEQQEVKFLRSMATLMK